MPALVAFIPPSSDGPQQLRGRGAIGSYTWTQGTSPENLGFTTRFIQADQDTTLVARFVDGSIDTILIAAKQQYWYEITAILVATTASAVIHCQR